MKVLEKHVDGTQTVLYEPGDRVRLIMVAERDNWLAKPGQLGTVIRRELPRIKGKPTSIDSLEVQTDLMRKHKYGTIRVRPWFVEYIGEEQSVVEEQKGGSCDA